MSDHLTEPRQAPTVFSTPTTRPKRMTQQTNAEDKPLPIDIDYAKFLPWLIDRRRVPRDWHTYIKTARSAARSAYSATPSAALEALSLPLVLDPHDFVTFQTVRFVLSAIEKSTADGTTDLAAKFGSTDNERRQLRQKWEKAQTAFQRKSVFLADAAQQLVRHTDIDAPALREKITKLIAESSDVARKESAAVKAAADAATRFDEACAQYRLDLNAHTEDGLHPDKDATAISNDDIDLHALVKTFVTKQAPGILTKAAEAAQNLTDALDYYDAFANFVAAPTKNKGDRPVKRRCPTLRAVAETDLKEVVRTRHSTTLSPTVGNETGNSANIDWGLEVEGSGTSGKQPSTDCGIDWGFDVIDVGESSATDAQTKMDATTSGKTINWSIEAVSTAASSGGTGSTEANGIDWGIEVADTNGGGKNGGGDTTGSTDTGAAVAATTTIAGQDNGSVISVMLANTEAREAFLDDVAEVEAFLEQRLIEVNARSNTGLEHTVWSEIQRCMGRTLVRKAREIDEMIEQAVQARVALAGDTARHVLTLHDNNRALQRVGTDLIQRKLGKQRAQQTIVTLRQRHNTAALELGQLTEQMSHINQVTGDVVRHCEETLSELYGGRDVHIMGNVRRLISDTVNR